MMCVNILLTHTTAAGVHKRMLQSIKYIYIIPILNAKIYASLIAHSIKSSSHNIRSLKCINRMCLKECWTA